ncbi:Monoacylglycerol lipase ABHD6 [Ananas comosus]|uniref:Monoacylglycerol lipase ABHD6 n=1 Tax=Ananas comosus TaxID=4615 RepID=A0A199W1F5_ANACO|nr:Monoacylglycerol lipase ABHD6 [Ananas comosus]
MVNLVELQKPLIHFLLKRAGLRQHAVEIEPGTVVSFWVPKEKVPKKKGTVNEVVPEGKSNIAASKDKTGKNEKEKPAVVLVHGFAAEASSRGSSRSAYWRSSVRAGSALFRGVDEHVDRPVPRIPSPVFADRAGTVRRGGVHGGRVQLRGDGGVQNGGGEARPGAQSRRVGLGHCHDRLDHRRVAGAARVRVVGRTASPESVKGLKALLSVATYRNLWFPDRLHNDYLKVMFSNRKERAELLEGLVISNKDAVVPALTQRILLLWGENDNIFNIELAKNMKEKLGEKTTLQAIKKAGHLAHLERPCSERLSKMMNVVKAEKSLLRFFVKRAGLRQHTIEIEPGTIIRFWIPKEKVPKQKRTVNEVVFKGKSDVKAIGKEKSGENSKKKPAVVLVHGFAADGIITWQFQIGFLARHYEVYMPDLLFFGGSTSTSTDRSPAFQAWCFLTALERLGVDACTVVGFSYGGFVAFKMAEAKPDVVRNLVVSGSAIDLTDSITDDMLERLGFASLAEMLLPESVKGSKALFSVGAYKKLPFPDWFHNDYLKVMFSNRKEKAELLEGLRILLLWGENDSIFKIGLAKNMKEQLGENTTLQAIKKAGHLAHLERPCVYNRHLKEFLAQLHNEPSQK